MLDWGPEPAVPVRLVGGTGGGRGIAFPVSLVDSVDCSGVQAADLVAYTVRRQAEETGAAPQTRRLAKSLCNRLTPALKHSAKWRS
jgi:hypothetical protein